MGMFRNAFTGGKLALVGMVALCVSVAGPPLRAEPPRASEVISAPEDLGTFWAEFWATQFGLPYAPGASAIVLTMESVSVAASGAWDAALLGDDGVATLEEFIGEPVLRTWGATVAGAGAAPDARPAQFAETYRAAMPVLAPSADELAAAGLSENSCFAVSGLFTGTTGVAQHVCGLLVVVVAVAGAPRATMFVPLGLAADDRNATAAARDLFVRPQGLASDGVEVAGAEPPGAAASLANPGDECDQAVLPPCEFCVCVRRSRDAAAWLKHRQDMADCGTYFQWCLVGALVTGVGTGVCTGGVGGVVAGACAASVCQVSVLVPCVLVADRARDRSLAMNAAAYAACIQGCMSRSAIEDDAK